MAEHKRRLSIKGSSVVIAAMYVFWIWFVAFQAWLHITDGVFLPPEVTYGSAACFIVETVALARIKLAKEGAILPKKKPNQFLSKLGIGDSELEDVAQEISAENEKEESNGRSGKQAD